MFGKRTDVVDFGGEADYSHMKWFQDAPPRPPQPPAAEQGPSTPYMPTIDTIHANENFEYALSAAPNVLYQRYVQYGQLGVLG